MGVNPYLQDTQFSKQIRLLSGFAAQVRTGFYGQQKQVKICTVSTALTAIGQTIALTCDSNPTKVTGSECFLPCLQIMLDCYHHMDPPTKTMLPVQADVPELLVKTAYKFGSSEWDKATANLTMIAFYYLLCIGEYTVKGIRNNSKQTVQFNYKDVTFFCKNNLGQLQDLPRDAPDELISTADGPTLKLDNQKNGWKGVCVYHKTNGDLLNCPVRALSRWYLHLCKHQANSKTFLSAYFEEGGKRADVTNEDFSKAFKCAGLALEYTTTKGIPITTLDTHSLRSGGANVLSLVGYSDTQTQKMGRWRGATFTEYIQEELACFLDGMSTNMKKQFKFVNIAGNAFSKITDKLMERDYNVNVSTACAA
jgi:hypothetical protein